MKKIISTMLMLVVGVSLAACSPKGSETATTAGTQAGAATGPTTGDSAEINVGVAFYPMKDILELITDDMAAEGYDLNVHEFTDYQTPNSLLLSKELDANMIQHDYFLQSFNQANDSNLVMVQPIYHATFAIYGKDYASVEEIPDGSVITLPDDATNFSRALYLLGQAELLTFKDGKTTGLTLEDIDTNPKNLVLDDQVPLTSLAQRYTETGLAIMYPTYALSLELEGDEQRIFEEKQDDVTKNYAISLAAREDNKDSDAIKALIKHITSEKVRQLLIDDYNWASSPAF